MNIMGRYYLGLYIIAIVFLLITFIKDPVKGYTGLKSFKKTVVGLLPSIIVLIFLISMIAALINPQLIVGNINPSSGLSGVVYAFFFGIFLFIPSYIAIPLAANLHNNGAGIAQLSTLIGSLMGIGIIYIPIEIKYFNKKFVIIHLLTAIVMALVVGIVLIIGGQG